MEPVIHFMQFGHTACFIAEPPIQWPAHHRWSSNPQETTCPACRQSMEYGESSYEILDDGRAFKCRRCGRTSRHPKYVQEHYCDHCHAYHDDIWPPARLAWMKSYKAPIPDLLFNE